MPTDDGLVGPRPTEAPAPGGDASSEEGDWHEA